MGRLYIYLPTFTIRKSTIHAVTFNDLQGWLVSKPVGRLPRRKLHHKKPYGKETIHLPYGWFPKIRVQYPKMDGFVSWKSLLKWMIWGYHHLRKHPYLPISLFGSGYVPSSLT